MRGVSDPVATQQGPRYWETPIYIGLLAGGPPVGALEDECAEGRTIVRVSILGPATVATDS